MNETLKIPAYQKGLFLDRNAERQEIKKFVLDRQKGKLSNCVIIFSGGRGAGKSWLALNLARDYFTEDKNVTTWFVRLWMDRDIESSCPNEWWLSDHLLEAEDPTTLASLLMEEIVNSLCNKLDLPDWKTYELPERIHNLALHVDNWPRNRVLLVILDSAFEGPQGKYNLLLDKLEDLLLAPLLKTGHTVLVVTGRGAQPAWNSAYLRDASKRILEGFHEEGSEAVDRSRVAEILGPENRFMAQLEAICELSGGYPLTVRLIATSEAQDLEHALDETIDHLLNIIADPEQRKTIRGILERLSILEKRFQAEELVYYLTDLGSQYKMGSSEYEKSLKTVQGYLELLSQYFILEYRFVSPEENGYLIDQSLRKPILYNLFQHKSSLYHKYRSAAASQFAALGSDPAFPAEIKSYYLELASSFSENRPA